MSTNAKLAEQLTAMRKQAATHAKRKPQPLDAPPAAAAHAAPPSEASPAVKARPPKRQGRGAVRPTTPPHPLDRATITLKAGDLQAMQELQFFLMKRGHKAPPVATLVRLAVHYTRSALKSQADALNHLYAQVLKEDGRKQRT